MRQQALTGLAFVLGLILVIPMGCSKDVLENKANKKSDFQGMTSPELSSFTIISKSYPGKDLSKARLNARKRNDANVFFSVNVPGYLLSDEIDTTKVMLGLGTDQIFLRQKYQFNMFTISDQSMALNIYPGAILDGRSVDGMFNPRMLLGISQNMRPITLSTSMAVAPSAVAKTSLPRPTAERALTNQALTSLEELYPGGVGASSISVEVDSFRVYDELKTMYGYNKSLDVFLVGANTTVKRGNHHVNSKSALKLKYFQQNFTIDVDVPKNYSELFDPTGLDMPALTGSKTPVYVKSVTYGRMGIIVIESEYSSIKLFSAVKKQVDILANLIGIDKNMTDEEKTIINSANIRIKYTGVNADADAMIKVNGLSGFIDLISANKTYSKESPGVPVAFTLNKLDEDHASYPAPFQIDYGPYERPYVKLKFENLQETYQSPWRKWGDLYAYFYKDPGGNLAYNDVPDFFPFPCEMTRNTINMNDWMPRFSSETETQNFYIKYGGIRHHIGINQISNYVTYGTEANSSRSNYSYRLIPNGYFLLAN